MAQAFPKTFADYMKNPTNYFSDVSTMKMSDADIKKQQSTMQTGQPGLDPNAMGQIGGLMGNSQVQKPKVAESDMTYTPYTQQQPTATSQDVDPYSPDVIAKFQNYLPQTYKPGTFQYNPETDAGLAVAQKTAMNQVAQDMVKRGRLYSSLTDTQMQQKAQELIPQYQKLAYEQFMGQQDLNRQSYNDEYKRVADILGLAEKQFKNVVEMTGKTPSGATTIKGLQDMAKLAETQASVNTERGRTIGEFADAQKTYFDTVGQELKNVGIKYDNAGKLVDIQGKQIENQADFDKAVADDFKRRMPNVTMSPDNMRYLNNYTRLSQDPRYAKTLQDIRLSNQNIDIAALINEANATGQTELADALQYLRYEKVYSDPDLLLKYGTNYGMDDLKVAKTAKEIAFEQSKIIGQELTNSLKTSELFVQQNTEDAQILKKISEAREQLNEEEISSIKLKYTEPNEKYEVMNKIQAYNNKVQSYNNAASAEARAQEDQQMKRQRFAQDITKGNAELEDLQINKTIKKTVDDYLKLGDNEQRERNEESAVKVYDLFTNAGVDPASAFNEMIDRGFDKDLVKTTINNYMERYRNFEANKDLGRNKGIQPLK